MWHFTVANYTPDLLFWYIMFRRVIELRNLLFSYLLDFLRETWKNIALFCLFEIQIKSMFWRKIDYWLCFYKAMCMEALCVFYLNSNMANVKDTWVPLSFKKLFEYAIVGRVSINFDQWMIYFC